MTKLWPDLVMGNVKHGTRIFFISGFLSLRVQQCDVRQLYYSKSKPCGFMIHSTVAFHCVCCSLRTPCGYSEPLQATAPEWLIAKMKTE